MHPLDLPPCTESNLVEHNLVVAREIDVFDFDRSPTS